MNKEIKKTRNHVAISFFNQASLHNLKQISIIMEEFCTRHSPSWHLLVQSWRWKQQNNVWYIISNNNKITMKRPKWRQFRHLDIFIVNFEQISCIVLEIWCDRQKCYSPSAALWKVAFPQVCGANPFPSIKKLNSL